VRSTDDVERENQLANSLTSFVPAVNLMGASSSSPTWRSCVDFDTNAAQWNEIALDGFPFAPNAAFWND